MITLFGANWRTTLSGWIAVLASAVAINPGLVAFLPEPVRTYVTGLAGVVAVLSGGTFATQAKDRNVTGGTVGGSMVAEGSSLNFFGAHVDASGRAIANTRIGECSRSIEAAPPRWVDVVRRRASFSHGQWLT